MGMLAEGFAGTEGGLEDLDCAAEEVFAGYAWQTPDQRRRSRAELVELALPFATRVARRYRGRGEPLEDLEQVARLALVKAVDRYDPARGSFTGYAGVTMTGEIRRHFRDHTWGVHVPRRYRDQVTALSVARSTLAMSLNRHPTDDELAERLGVSTEELRNIMVGAAGYQSA